MSTAGGKIPDHRLLDLDYGFHAGFELALRALLVLAHVISLG